jgi:hypothetical protein
VFVAQSLSFLHPTQVRGDPVLAQRGRPVPSASQTSSSVQSRVHVPTEPVITQR